MASTPSGARSDVHLNGSASSAPSSVTSLCFSTDLLFNLDDVRADCASGLAAHGNLVTMLKSRINLEKTYAQELNKMARYSRLDEMEHGTMKFALASLRAQYLNTSVQHQQLAKNLEEDVLGPIEALYEYNNQRAQSLTRRINSVKKDAKAQEDAYRRDYSAFDKNFKEASASFSAAMDLGFSSTLLEDQYHRRIARMEVGESPMNTNYSTTLATRPDKSSGTTALKTINNNKLVSWLLASAETHRKEDAASNTVKLMEAAERSRRKCQQSWHGVETYRIRLYRAVQSVLADYQQIAEDRILTIATNLRKHVVFASSALANDQYDWQVISTKFESVDLKSDIQDFIKQCQSSQGSVLLADMTVNDLCNDTTRSLVSSPSSKPCRPLRKTCLEIRDISSRKIPFDYDGNQELLCEALGTRPSRPAPVKHRQQFDHQEISCRDGYSRLRIDCSASSTDQDSTGVISVSEVQAVEDPSDVELENKSSITDQSEPQHDTNELTPSGSPSGSSDSRMMHFTNHDQEFEVDIAQTELVTAPNEL